MSLTSYADKLKSPKWQRRRLEVMSAADFKCQACGDAETELHVHHREYIKGREPWEYEAGELMCLCEDCHKLAHMPRAKIAKWVGLMEPSIIHRHEIDEPLRAAEAALASGDQPAEEARALLIFRCEYQKWIRVKPTFRSARELAEMASRAVQPFTNEAR